MPEELPSFDQLSTIEGIPTSRDVWKDQRLGALELLTADRALRASGLVHKGSVFALDAALDEPDPPLFGREPLINEIEVTRFAAQDHIKQWNTQSSTQWDGFLHVRDVKLGFLGGLAQEEHGVNHWNRHGFVGRAVLVDAYRWREAEGRPMSFQGYDAIQPEELNSILKSQRVEIDPGDILLLHTGWLDRYRALSPGERKAVSADNGLPGLANGIEMARTLWDLHIAAVASDNPSLEAWRPEGDFLHFWLLPRLGIPIGELFDLGALAADCAEDGVYESCFVSVPLNLPGGVASPPNAIAIK